MTKDGNPANRAGTILLSLLFISGIVCADSVLSSITCNGASFVSSSVIRPEKSWSESLFTSDMATIARSLITGESVQTKTLVKSQGPMGIFEHSDALSNQTGDQKRCLFDRPENETTNRYETTVLGLMQQGLYSSLLSQDDISRFLIQANGTGILLTRAKTSGETEAMSHASDLLGEMNMTEEMEFGEDDGN